MIRNDSRRVTVRRRFTADGNPDSWQAQIARLALFNQRPASGAVTRPFPAWVHYARAYRRHQTVACGNCTLMSSTTTERELIRSSGAIPRTYNTIATTAGDGGRVQNIRISRRRSPSGQWRIVLISLEGERIAEMSMGAARMLARQLLTEVSNSATETRLLGYWREIQIVDATT